MHLTLLVAIACCPSVNPEQLLHYPLWQQLTAWLNVPISQFGKDKDKAKDKACQSSKDNLGVHRLAFWNILKTLGMF